MPPTSRDARLLTRRFALSRAEWATTAAAVVVSTAAYVDGGHAYLARAVVGGLLGFAALAAVGVAAGARLRHEALACLGGIGVVVRLGPEWPLEVPSAAWWVLVAAGLAGYLGLRRRLCD